MKNHMVATDDRTQCGIYFAWGKNKELDGEAYTAGKGTLFFCYGVNDKRFVTCQPCKNIWDEKQKNRR